MCIQDLRAKSSTIRALLGACATIVIAMVSLRWCHCDDRQRIWLALTTDPGADTPRCATSRRIGTWLTVWHSSSQFVGLTMPKVV